MGIVLMYCENFLELYASMKLKIELSQLETEKNPVKKMKIMHRFHLELSTLLYECYKKPGSIWSFLKKV